jgi:hypothetical protein
MFSDPIHDGQELRQMVPIEVQQLENDGYFERARNGDHKAASLFARLAAYRLNPGGHGSSFGCLRKGGGQNVDGYAEDAIVANANPSDVQNVYDLVSGAGAPGASVSWNGPLPRRPTDTWEAPRPLTAAELAYLKPGSTPTDPPPPPPPAQCRFQPGDGVALSELAHSSAKIQAAVIAILGEMAAFGQTLSGIGEAAMIAAASAQNAEIAAKDAREALRNGLEVELAGKTNRLPILGTVEGTLKGSAKG